MMNLIKFIDGKYTPRLYNINQSMPTLAHQYVFVYGDHPVKECNTKAWKNALKRAGIKNFRWHDLRHTWASWHVQSGTSLQELQQLGGWASFEMVLRYAHLSSDHLKGAAITGTNLVHRGLQ